MENYSLKEHVETGMQKLAAQVNDRLGPVEQRLMEMHARVLDMQQKGTGHGGGALSLSGRTGLAHKLASDSGWQALIGGQKSSGRITLSAGIAEALETKGTVSAQYQAESTDGVISVQPHRVPGLFGYGYRALRLLDVLPRLVVTSNTVTHVRLNGYQNAAAVQAGEGQPKAEAAVDSELIVANIATISHILPVSRQVLQDEPGLAQSLNRLLGHGCQDKLEAELINGQGGQFDIEGFIEAGTLFSGNATNFADEIGAALAAMEGDGYSAGFVLVHPGDWHRMRSERTSDGYIAGGWAMPAAPSIWNTPVIATRSVPVGSAVLVDTAHVALLDRQQVTVEASESDGDNFRRNMVSIRAELRAGLMVGDAAAVRIVADPAPSSV